MKNDRKRRQQLMALEKARRILHEAFPAMWADHGTKKLYNAIEKALRLWKGYAWDEHRTEEFLNSVSGRRHRNAPEST